MLEYICKNKQQKYRSVRAKDQKFSPGENVHGA
jgi:hypothetical protein